MLFMQKSFSTLAKTIIRLSFEYFISRKTLTSVVHGKKVSKPIVRISLISIILAVVVNLITIAVVTGFQQEVRQKVIGFGSHIFLHSEGGGDIYESNPIRIAQPMIKEIKKDNRIASVNPVGYKPVLFQSDKKEITYKLPDGRDTSEIQQNVFGAVIKGIASDYDLSFYKEHLVKGELPVFNKDTISDAVLISKTLASNLHFSVGDTVNAFFVRNQPVKRKFRIAGIYETGLEEFDLKTVIGDLRYVQELSDWGIKAEITVDDTMYNGQLIIRADVTGGNGNYRFDWGKGFKTFNGFTLCPLHDTTIRLIASDYWSDVNAPMSETTLADTAYLKVTIKGTGLSYCDFKMNDINELDKNYLSEDGRKFSLQASEKTVFFESTPGKGTSDEYIGGFEISLNNWDELDEVYNDIEKRVKFIPTPYDELIKVTSIKQSQNEIFVWLGFLDINVAIIITLMIIIGIINMGSALLVLILIRTNFIGMMKAMGANNWSIRKIFLMQAGYLIGRGMLWGNVIGLAICFIQAKFNIISLNPEIYYLNKVPIELEFFHWLLLNVGTLVVCLTALIIPSVVITRISPVKAIKFN